MKNKLTKAIAITGIGMITSVGRTAFQSCSSIRADISKITDIDYFDYENNVFEKVPLKGAPITGVTDGHLGLGRFKKLAYIALNDLLSECGLTENNVEKTGFYTALPPIDRKGVDKRIENQLFVDLNQWLPDRITKYIQFEKTFPQGHAACVNAVSTAITALNDKTITHAVVGGIDSLVEPDTLDHFMAAERLITEENPDGFFPGEAAACFLLETVETAAKRDAEIYAVIEAPSSSVEPDTALTDQPSSTKGFREAIQATFEQLKDKGEKTGLILCDLNGEMYRAKEFGTLTPAVLNRITTPYTILHPSENTGDTGAASFAVSVCCAARALQLGYAGTDNVLIGGASDEGLRGSVYLRTYKNI